MNNHSSNLNQLKNLLKEDHILRIIARIHRAGNGIKIPKGIKILNGIRNPKDIKVLKDIKIPKDIRISKAIMIPIGTRTLNGIRIPNGIRVSVIMKNSHSNPKSLNLREKPNPSPNLQT